MSVEQGPSRLDNVQALRALAALMVVVLHAHGLGIKAGHAMQFLAPADPWGSAGVDLFFVISGFIMVHIHDRRPRSPARFLADRAARIAPLYWLVTGLFALAIGRGLMAPVEAGPGQPWSSLAFLSQALSGAKPLLYVGWTLEYEAFFYGCFAASIALGRHFGRDLLPFLAALVLGAVVIGAADLVAVEFLYGAVLARALPQVTQGVATRLGAGLLVAGIAMMAASLGRPGAESVRALAWGVPAAAMVAGAVLLPQRAGAAARLLGDSSYSLYLVHLFALAFFLALIPPGGAAMTLVEAIAATLLVAIAVHRWIERPLTALARRLMAGVAARRPAVAAGLQARRA